MRNIEYRDVQNSPVGPILLAGFISILLTLTVWFVIHLPWIGVAETPARVILIATWFLSLAGSVWLSKPARPMVVGFGAGLLSAVLGSLLVAGTKSRPAVAEAAPTTEELGAGAGLLVLSVLGMGLVLGLVAGLLGGMGPGAASRLSNRPRPWLERFAIVTAAAVAPLLFVGGLVTSTDSGMAVPDWPTTFGSSMFTYPLGQATPTDVYLEHSHRLFGTLVGMASLVLLVWVFLAGVTGWARKVAVAVFVLVAAQGILGGARVIQDSRTAAMVHGVLAQLVFALVVALACYLTPSFRSSAPQGALPRDRARRLRFFATGLMHALVVQLLLGALSRHYRGVEHAVFTHIGLSVIIVIMATIVGFMGTALPPHFAGGIAALRRTGTALVTLVVLQFLLGWGAFFMRGAEIAAETPGEALVRTAHQANGSLVLAAATITFVWARWLWRGVRTQPSPVEPAAPASHPGVTPRPA